jgi:hypothetical protein
MTVEQLEERRLLDASGLDTWSSSDMTGDYGSSYDSGYTASTDTSGYSSVDMSSGYDSSAYGSGYDSTSYGTDYSAGGSFGGGFDASSFGSSSSSFGGDYGNVLGSAWNSGYDSSASWGGTGMSWSSGTTAWDSSSSYDTGSFGWGGSYGGYDTSSLSALDNYGGWGSGGYATTDYTAGYGAGTTDWGGEYGGFDAGYGSAATDYGTWGYQPYLTTDSAWGAESYGTQTDTTGWTSDVGTAGTEYGSWDTGSEPWGSYGQSSWGDWQATTGSYATNAWDTGNSWQDTVAPSTSLSFGNEDYTTGTSGNWEQDPGAWNTAATQDVGGVPLDQASPYNTTDTRMVDGLDAGVNLTATPLDGATTDSAGNSLAYNDPTASPQQNDRLGLPPATDFSVSQGDRTLHPAADTQDGLTQAGANDPGHANLGTDFGATPDKPGTTDVQSGPADPSGPAHPANSPVDNLGDPSATGDQQTGWIDRAKQAIQDGTQSASELASTVEQKAADAYQAAAQDAKAIKDDLSNQVSEAARTGDYKELTEDAQTVKEAYDAAKSTVDALQNPLSVEKVGKALNDVLSVNGVLDSQPGDKVDHQYQKLAKDALDLALSLPNVPAGDKPADGDAPASGTAPTPAVLSTVDKLIPKITKVGDDIATTFMPGVIDRLSTAGANFLNDHQINPYDPTSFGGNKDDQVAGQRLVNIANGLFDGGFSGAAKAGIPAILELGDQVQKNLFPSVVPATADYLWSQAERYGLDDPKMYERLDNIATGFMNDGWKGAAKAGLPSILELGDMVGKQYFSQTIDKWSDALVNTANQLGLNPYNRAPTVNPVPHNSNTPLP